MQRVENITLTPQNRLGANQSGRIIQSLRRFVRLKIVIPYLLVALLLAMFCGMGLLYWTSNLLFAIGLVCLLSPLFGKIAYMMANQVSRPLETIIDTIEELTGHQAVSLNTPTASFPDFAQTLTGLGEINVQMRQLAHLRTLLTRYLGEDIAQRILDGETNLGGELIWATALFADIRDFTSMTETTDMHALFSELNDYYSVIQRVIAKHGGVINKFGGDSVLALFGAPTYADQHALSAVLAAGSIMDDLAVLNESRKQQGRPPFRIGIGVNTGQMMIGNLGSQQRLEYTVLGDCVNVAKRLSDLSKETPFYSIYVGSECVQEIGELPASWEVDSLGEKAVKGRREKIETFAVTPGEPVQPGSKSHKEQPLKQSSPVSLPQPAFVGT